MDAIERRLETVRGIAIGFIEHKQPEQWQTYVAELRRGAVMRGEGAYRIGRWAWDEQAFTLLREVDVAPVTFRYGLKFRQTGPDRFEVANDFVDRERWEIE